MKKENVFQIVIVGSCLLFYEIAVRAGWLDSFTFIPFTEMVQSMIHFLDDSSFLREHIWPTFIEIVISFVGAAILGVGIGLLLWRSDFMHYMFQPYLLLFYAIPFFAIYPIFITLFGTGPLSVIMVGILFSAPAVISNTAIGFRETKKVLIKYGQSLNLSFSKMLWHIYFPSAWPYIFSGLKLATAYSIIGVVATEFILSARGIGYSISYAYNNFDLYSMYGAILLVIVISLLSNTILGYIENRLFKRHS
jgi:NitT/TauT family transport system permease protein